MRRIRFVSAALFSLLAVVGCSSSGDEPRSLVGLDAAAAPPGPSGAMRGSVAPRIENGGGSDAGGSATAGAGGAGTGGGGSGGSGAGGSGAGGSAGAAAGGAGGTTASGPDAGTTPTADASAPVWTDAAAPVCPPRQAGCREIQNRYVAAVEAARACRALRVEPLDVCAQEVSDRLGPCGCPTWVGQQTDELRAVRAEWEASGCAACGIACEVGETRERCKPIGRRGTCKPNSGKPAESDLLPIVPGTCEPTKD